MKWYNKKIERIRHYENDWYHDAKKPFGFLYFIKAGNFVKVGCSKNVKKRISAHQVSNPHECILLCSIKGDMFDLEKEAQLELKQHHYRGEWYKLTPKVKEYIKLVKKHNKLFPFKWVTDLRNNPRNPLFNGEWKVI